MKAAQEGHLACLGQSEREQQPGQRGQPDVDRGVECSGSCGVGLLSGEQISRERHWPQEDQWEMSGEKGGVGRR